MSNTQSAHVCTGKHPLFGWGWMPDFSQGYIWILGAAENRAAADILWAHWLKLKQSKVSDAIHAGKCALIECAESDEKAAIERGLLLHIGTPVAVQKARELQNRFSARREVTC